MAASDDRVDLVECNMATPAFFPCALVVIITGVLVGSLELFFLMLLLHVRFLLEVVHLALGACLSIPSFAESVLLTH